MGLMGLMGLIATQGRDKGGGGGGITDGPEQRSRKRTRAFGKKIRRDGVATRANGGNGRGRAGRKERPWGGGEMGRRATTSPTLLRAVLQTVVNVTNAEQTQED